MTGFVISNAKPIRKNSLIGFFDLQMPSGLIVRGAMLFEKSGKRWVSFPSEKFVKRDGTVVYTTIIEFVDRATSDRFQAAVTPLAEGALLGGVNVLQPVSMAGDGPIISGMRNGGAP
jgi:hypothetical protein